MNVSVSRHRGQPARLLVGLVLVVCMGLTMACSDEAPPTDTPEQGELRGPRIVSTSPAISQALIDMNMGNRIVGRNDYDQTLPREVPVVATFATGRLDIRTEALLNARPTHVFIEGPIPSALRGLADRERGGFTLVSFDSPRSIESLSELLYHVPPSDRPGELTAQGLGGVLEAGHYAVPVKVQLLQHGDELQRLTRHMPEPRPRVLMVIGLEGPMVSGTGTLHDDVLTRWLGAVNAVTAKPDNADETDNDANGESDDPSDMIRTDNDKVQLKRSITGPAPILSRELLVATQADVILLFLDDREPLRDIMDDPRLAIFRNLPIPAVTNNRIVLIDDPLAKLPSTSIVRIANRMAKAIYPQLAPDISLLTDSVRFRINDLPDPEEQQTPSPLDEP
ncbi:MAG: hypothetical protein JJU36_16420 [Phycisphaeraceae bacterium]|nr:hypothetical protein [Phycisphaeraceae bacterium]